MNRKYPEDHSTVDKVGCRQLIAEKSCFVFRSRREIKVDINKLTKSTKTLVVRLRRQQVIGTLSRDDEDVDENET